MVEETPQETPVVSAKVEILNRVRVALIDRKSDRESDYAYIQRQYHVNGKRHEPALLDLFTERLQDYGTSVYRCEEATIHLAIGTALAKRGVKNLVTGEHFSGGWIPAGFDFSKDAGFTYQQINSFDGVVTPCALAIAETGTIILRHAGDEPRRAISLIPDYHLCVVFAQQVVETVPEGVRQMAVMGEVPLTTVSGPSATSDIEMTRIKGVHGPRTLDVILVC